MTPTDEQTRQALLRRPPWQRLEPHEQQFIADYAAEHGLLKTSNDFAISVSAVRRACAERGVAFRTTEDLDKRSRQRKLRHARAYLRALGLTAQDLLDNP